MDNINLSSPMTDPQPGYPVHPGVFGLLNVREVTTLVLKVDELLSKVTFPSRKFRPGLKYRGINKSLR
jgi:hypothetical protein